MPARAERTHPERRPFGLLLAKYRKRLAGKRRTQTWLGEKLGKEPARGKVMIAKWETGDEHVRPPTRSEILQIGRLYSLRSEEVDALFKAAKESFEADRWATPEEYEPLTQQDVKRWKVVLGPSRVSLDAWAELLTHAQKSHRLGEWHAVHQTAGTLLDQTRASAADQDIGALWDYKEWQKMEELFLAAWDEYAKSGQRLSRGKRRVLRNVIAANPNLTQIMRTIVWLSFPLPPPRQSEEEPEGTPIEDAR